MLETIMLLTLTFSVMTTNIAKEYFDNVLGLNDLYAQEDLI